MRWEDTLGLIELGWTGEVEDYRVLIEMVDFGDAPDRPYPTTLRSGGARHLLGSGLLLGRSVDADPDGQPGPDADGDDTDGLNDDDGVQFSTRLVAGTTALLGVTSAALALVALRVATGAGNVGLRLSRQSYITRHVDPRARGRAMSTIGGSFRVSLFLGPLVGGILAEVAGFTTTFVVAGAIAAVEAMLAQSGGVV